MSKDYRPGLPEPIPGPIKRLPVQNGFPVPWFVAQVNGVYDFRCVDSRKFEPALRKCLCWVCGQQLGKKLAFPIGPMCAITRCISEPPSHPECAEWSIKACPFLAQRQEERRLNRLPDDIKEPPGIAIARQPGAVLLWITHSFETIHQPEGLLFQIGDPIEVAWYCQGRTATRAEVLQSIDSGYPILQQQAKRDGPAAVGELKQRRRDIETLLPTES